MKNDPRHPEHHYISAEAADAWRYDSGEWNPSMYNDRAAESFDMFSDDPLRFEEIAFMVWNSFRDIYKITQFNNRFSDKYKTACIKFEKLVKEAARCCVTKAVLEQKDHSFPMLGDLSIESLYRAVSFNFRKTYASIQEKKLLRGTVDVVMLELISGWSVLLDRLKSTEERIRLLREGKLKADSLIARAQLFLNQPTAAKPKETISREKDPGSETAPRKAPAFPVLGSVLRTAGMDETALKADAKPEEEKAADETKPYASMKQRKKAERLARKQSRQAAEKSPREKEPSGVIHPTDVFRAEDEAELVHLYEEFQRSLKPEEAFLADPRRIPVPIGVAPPVRA